MWFSEKSFFFSFDFPIFTYFLPFITMNTMWYGSIESVHIFDTYKCMHPYAHWWFQWNGPMTINFQMVFKRTTNQNRYYLKNSSHKRAQEKDRQAHTHAHFNPIFIWSFYGITMRCCVYNTLCIYLWSIFIKWMGCRQTFYNKLNILLKRSFLLILPFHIYTQKSWFFFFLFSKQQPKNWKCKIKKKKKPSISFKCLIISL